MWSVKIGYRSYSLDGCSLEHLHVKYQSSILQDGFARLGSAAQGKHLNISFGINSFVENDTPSNIPDQK